MNDILSTWVSNKEPNMGSNPGIGCVYVRLFILIILITYADFGGRIRDQTHYLKMEQTKICNNMEQTT